MASAVAGIEEPGSAWASYVNNFQLLVLRTANPCPELWEPRSPVWMAHAYTGVQKCSGSLEPIITRWDLELLLGGAFHAPYFLIGGLRPPDECRLKAGMFDLTMAWFIQVSGIPIDLSSSLRRSFWKHLSSSCNVMRSIRWSSPIIVAFFWLSGAYESACWKRG